MKIDDIEYSLKDIILNEYSDSLMRTVNDGVWIYKGMRSPKLQRDKNTGIEYAVYNPIKNRKSRNTYNFYTLWINNHKEWQSFPDRNVICTLNFQTATSYGRPYLILPKNNTKIGVCPDVDFWYSFKKFDNGLTDPSYLNYCTEKILSYISMNITPLRFDTYDNMIAAFKYVDDNLETLTNDIGFMEIVDEHFKTDGKLVEVFFENGLFGLYKEFYKPDEFSIVDTKNIEPGNNEVWFDNSFIIIEDNSTLSTLKDLLR